MKPQKHAYKAALYMRLSKDDDRAGESGSIITQRKMLRAYAREQNFFIQDEYIDDGVSGTTFDRPEFNRMITDIEIGKINLVITKDLSRLGRDYIATGQYTEIYFPSKKVRYIAVNDGYDSDSPYTDIAPFKNVINEMYARDTSKKIRSAFQTKIQDGLFIGNFAPYGYQKDSKDKNHLVVDPVSGAVVQEIFRLSIEGKRPSDIAAILNSRHIMSPAMYRCALRPHLNAENFSKRQEWTSAGVSKVLKNIVYLGHTAQGKTSKVSFKSNVTLIRTPEEWTVVKNTHEPLISQEVYNQVKKQRVARRNSGTGQFQNIFSGIAVCADCGRHMSTTGTRKKGTVANLVCGGYKLYGSKECSNHFIDYELLHQEVLADLRSHILLTTAEKQALLDQAIAEAEQRRTAVGGGKEAAARKEGLEARSQALDTIIGKLYEEKVGGRLSEERFCKLLEQYETEQKTINGQLFALEGFRGKRRKKTSGNGEFYRLVEEIVEVKDLTAELLHKLVDKIEISQGSFEGGKRSGTKSQIIRIHYKFLG